ncbi:Prohibitin [Corchorus olitorius]|uniref:Prohibitin n=1 Tax=Corchorus olitorius TaxID=93759 RepID=A0A1R3JQA2_9ROSI|nr:Prohibitin [Corchorus olitorius]
MNLNNVKVPKMPGGGALPALLKLGVIGGLGVYGIANSLYNVDGGHRAIVFNRIKGIKDEIDGFAWMQFLLDGLFKVLVNWSGMYALIPFLILKDLRIIYYVIKQAPLIILLDNVKLSEQLMDLVFYMLVVLNDYKQVKIGLRVLTRPDAAELPTIYRTLAKSAQLIGQAIANNPAFITLRRIEASREIAHTMSNSANKIYLSSDDFLLNLQDMKLDSVNSTK